jgi:hypothetical protein
MIFKVKVNRNKQHRDDMRSFFCGDTAEVIINGNKYTAKGDSPSVMDGISLEGAIIGRVLDTVMDSWKFEVHSSFLYWFGYWRCGQEVYDFIHRFDGKSEYEIEGDELKVLYERWEKEELPKIEERNRKWKEENDKLEKKCKYRNDTIKCERITIDAHKISDPVVKWSDIKLKPFNILEAYKLRAKTTLTFSEDEELVKLLTKKAKNIKKKKKMRNK